MPVEIVILTKTAIFFYGNTHTHIITYERFVCFTPSRHVISKITNRTYRPDVVFERLHTHGVCSGAPSDCCRLYLHTDGTGSHVFFEESDLAPAAAYLNTCLPVRYVINAQKRRTDGRVAPQCRFFTTRCGEGVGRVTGKKRHCEEKLRVGNMSRNTLYFGGAV